MDQINCNRLKTGIWGEENIFPQFFSAENEPQKTHPWFVWFWAGFKKFSVRLWREVMWLFGKETNHVDPCCINKLLHFVCGKEPQKLQSLDMGCLSWKGRIEMMSFCKLKSLSFLCGFLQVLHRLHSYTQQFRLGSHGSASVDFFDISFPRANPNEISPFCEFCVFCNTL